MMWKIVVLISTIDIYRFCNNRNKSIYIDENISIYRYSHMKSSNIDTIDFYRFESYFYEFIDIVRCLSICITIYRYMHKQYIDIYRLNDNYRQLSINVDHIDIYRRKIDFRPSPGPTVFTTLRRELMF